MTTFTCPRQQDLPLAISLPVWQPAAMMIASENQFLLTHAASMKK